MLFAIPIIKKKKEFYVQIYLFNKGIIDTNHALFQIPKKKLVEIFLSKKEAFYIKITIQKLGKKAKYTLPNLHIKVNQGCNLVIIIYKPVKRLGLKVKFTSIFSNHCLIFVGNRDSTKLKSEVKF